MSASITLSQSAGQGSSTNSVLRGNPREAPKLIYAPDPEFSAQTRKEHRWETILLQLTVGSDGLPGNIKVARSLNPELDEIAIGAVKKWKFVPATTKDGRPVSATITAEIQVVPYQ